MDLDVSSADGGHSGLGGQSLASSVIGLAGSLDGEQQRLEA